MDCLFCNCASAEHLHVPTVLGVVSDLCSDCLHKFGRRSRREFVSTDYSNETSGPVTAARPFEIESSKGLSNVKCHSTRSSGQTK